MAAITVITVGEKHRDAELFFDPPLVFRGWDAFTKWLDDCIDRDIRIERNYKISVANDRNEV